MASIIFVTGNKNKIHEAELILKPFNISISGVDLSIDEVQADDVEYIAKRAAEDAYKILQTSLIVEDSGLYIDALNGFPGPYSSYVYKTLGIQGILKLMADIKRRNATFKAAVAYTDGSTIKIFTGLSKGWISLEARGEGWGFDPIFVPEGSIKTFGEMSVDEKNFFSHRGKALMNFAKWFSNK